MKKIFVLIICFLLCSCSSKEVFRDVVVDEYVPESTKLTLTMVGDAYVHASINSDAYEDGKYGFYKMFDDVRSEFLNSDLLYYNQETIIGGDKLGISGYPKFNTPEVFGTTMINIGFNVVSRANEHVFDKKEAGILNACNFWNAFPNVLTHGSACTIDERNNPKIMEMNGITYTMLSYTTVNKDRLLNDYYINVYSDELVKRDIEKVRDKVDVLLVAMHWGGEYESTPNEEQIRIAEYLAGLGVKVVIGTHPHVIQPIKWIDDTLVIYSLGNFISGQSNVNSYNRLIGLLVNVDIIKTTVKDRVKVELSNLNTELLYTYNKDKKNFRVIPFSKLDDTLLKNYRSLKVKYDAIVKYYDSRIVTN